MYPETWGSWQTRFLAFLAGAGSQAATRLDSLLQASYTQHTFVTGLRAGQVLVEILIKTPEKSGQNLALT